MTNGIYQQLHRMTPPSPNFEKHLEVTAMPEIIDNSEDILNQTVGLRLQGNSTRGWYKKRSIVESHPELSGSRIFPVDIFPGVSTHSMMTKDSMVDAIIYDLTSDRSVSAQKSVPVRVFLNGEYLYDSYLLERYDKQYFRAALSCGRRSCLVKDGAVQRGHIHLRTVGAFQAYDGLGRQTLTSPTRQEWAAVSGRSGRTELTLTT